MKKGPFVAFLLVSLILIISGATADIIQVQNVKVNTVGATMPVDLVLDTSSSGIAGYNIIISLSNPSVATITNVSFPSWAILNDSTSLPASFVQLRSVDLHEQVNIGSTNVPFGTVTLQGKMIGSTGVLVTIEEIDSDEGVTISPDVIAGTFIVDSAYLQPLIANHTSTQLSQIPQTALDRARSNLHIAYGHTSHGNQIIVGMDGLETFGNAPYGCTTYFWNDGISSGNLDLDDHFVDGDLGNSNWAQQTRDYLDEPANSDVNVVMWSWCGQANTDDDEYIANYLSQMSQLESEYPEVTFVYMTGHLAGSGESGDLNQRNEQIRNYVRANNKVLYDFADIESFDPDGLIDYMKLNANDNCDYDGEHNWATEWQAGHVEGVDWYDCSPDHTQALNGNQKAYAAWWLWARLAGWGGKPVSEATVGIFRPSTNTWYLDKSGNGVYGAGDVSYNSYGVSTDVQVTGDWNGDGITEIGIFRPSTRTWYLDKSGNGVYGAGDVSYNSYGVSTDVQVTGDWNGDGITEIGIFRPSTRTWYLDFTGNGVYGPGDISYTNFGVPTDVQLTGDWNGDGITEIGIFRPSTKTWYLDSTGNGIFGPGDITHSNFGNALDIQVTSDWNTDGVTEIGIFRPSTNTWYLDINNDGVYGAGDMSNNHYGISSDRQKPGRW